MKTFRAFAALILIYQTMALASCSKLVLLPAELNYSETSVKAETSAKTTDITLIPNGSQTFEWSFRLLNNEGQPVSGVQVNFSVEPLFPLKGWRDVNEVATRYGSNAATLRKKVTNGTIRLNGTVAPATVTTDNEGFAKTIYTVSHIGSNSSEPGQEKIIARAGEFSGNTIITIGYNDLIAIPEVEGGLRIGDATGRHVQQSIAELLKNLGTAIKAEKWPQPLTVTAGTLRWGGLYPPHFTHRRGGTLDFRPMSTDGNPTWCNTDGTHAGNYDRARTLTLIKIFFASGAKEIFFNDPQAITFGAKPLSGHNNHLHASWLLDKERDIINTAIKTKVDLKILNF